MLRFRPMKTLQKLASVHANVHNHFNLERHLIDRQTYKERRSAALAEWLIVAFQSLHSQTEPHRGKAVRMN
jgi:putative transposase